MATSEPLNRYSVAGAMGTQTYQGANALNQYPSLTPVNGTLTALTYDLNGNLMDDGTNSYTFDALNSLVSVTGSVTAGYVHDALDRRVSKFAGGVTTRFVHAGSDEIAEYTDTGVLLRRYVPGAGVDERAAMIDSGSTTPPLTALRLPHTDRLGSVMAVTNSAGAVTERFAYNAFGVSNSSAAGYPFRYTGQRIDPETGLMFYKARVYSTTLGRFLQTDPIGAKDDLNLYAYVGNDPVNKTDPTGMEAVAWLMKNDPRYVHSGSGYGPVTLEQVQTGLDYFGLYPGIGEPADAINAAISLWNGEYEDAALSIGATFPIVGMAATAGKLSIKHGDEVLEVAEGSVGVLRSSGAKDAHHIIQDASVRDLPGYNSNAAPGVQLPGPSTLKGSPHNVATRVQAQSGGGTYGAERRIGYKALRKAGFSEDQARLLIGKADGYFSSLGVSANTPTRVPGNR